MLIIRDGKTVEVPDLFMEEGYLFDAERVKAIISASGLRQVDFAEVYNFTYYQVVSWTRNEDLRKNPNAGARLTLAFIEMELFEKKMLAARTGAKILFEDLHKIADMPSS